MLSLSKFLGILAFQSMLILAKRIVNFALDTLTRKEKTFQRNYGKNPIASLYSFMKL